MHHTQRGFTLVEAMVTVAVVVILAAVATPALQAFVARTGMNTVRDDFAIALQRARLDAISRNTCVSVCQLDAPGSAVCATTNLGQWHRGWVVFVNDACGEAPSGDLPANDVILVREPGNPRYQVIDEGASAALVTFNPRGALVVGNATFEVTDAEEPDSTHRRDISLSLQGRVQVSMHDDKPAKQDGEGDQPVAAEQ